MLKDRVSDPGELVDAMHRVVSGQTVIDPEVGEAMLRAAHNPDPIAAMSTREREVLALMAEGRSNAGIAERLGLELKTIEGHVGQILSKLDIEPQGQDHRRVLAVLAWLREH